MVKISETSLELRVEFYYIILFNVYRFLVRDYLYIALALTARIPILQVCEQYIW